MHEHREIADSSQGILDEFDRNRKRYDLFAAKMEGLIRDLLSAIGVHVHSVSRRVKERESLGRKLLRGNGKYTRLGDVTDIAGIRIVAYFAADVDRIAECIEREFAVDRRNSPDRRAASDPDRFGYGSLHQVVGLSLARLKLAEYRAYTGLKIEVQTRSILQHAWAEIEHDLGYKTSNAVPQVIRRRFSRLAGLLELADEEFQSIRNELLKYEQQVQQDIHVNPGILRVDKDSLAALIQQSEPLRLIDQAAVLPHAGVVEPPEHRFIERLIACLKYFRIETIGDLQKALAVHHEEIIAFHSHLIQRRKYDLIKGVNLPGGFGLLLLCFYLAARRGRIEDVEAFLDSAFPGASVPRDYQARMILESYNEAIQTLRAGR